MKSRKTTGLLILFLITCTFYQGTFSLGWANGSYSYNATSYDYGTEYGTHDWIADGALQALLAHDSSNWNWLDQRERIYFIGTEAPDNSGVSMTLDGTQIEGMGDTTWHHIYYNEDGTIFYNEDDAGLRAKSMGDLADAYIEENKLDLAAFYLGAMTHYIADTSMYAHVARNNVDPYNVDFDEHHSDVENYVKSRTNSYTDKEEFFKISTASIGSKAPYDAVKDLGWDTYKDPNGSNDAKWMHDNFFTGWAQTYSTRLSDTTTHQEYYNRIEESLNNAIEACIAAMNYIIGGSTSTNTGGDDSIDSLLTSIPSYPIPILVSFTLSSLIAIVIIKVKRLK